MSRAMTRTMVLGATMATMMFSAAAYADCWTTGSGLKYCADDTMYSFDMHDSSKKWDDVTATMHWDQSTKTVYFQISEARCTGSGGMASCLYDGLDQYRSPDMTAPQYYATAEDSDILLVPFSVTIRLHEGDDHFTGKTILTRPDGTTQTFNYFPASVFGQKGRDRIKYAWYADGGDGVDEITGSVFDDILKGGPGADTIRGNDGDDIIRGQGGDDDLYGDDGDDDIDGGFTYDSSKPGNNSQVNDCYGGNGHDEFKHCAVMQQS